MTGGRKDAVARSLRWLRVGVYGTTLLAILYLVARFDLLRLPSEGCSPLHGIEPGDRLLVDAHGKIVAGDAILFRDPDGSLRLGRVGEPPPSAPEDVLEPWRAGALWLVPERPDCPGEDSRLRGTVEPDAVAGRVVANVPW